MCQYIINHHINIFRFLNFADGVGAFGIIGPKEKVTKGDNVELICAASVYNYTNELTWTKLENETETPVIETGNYSKQLKKLNKLKKRLRYWS